MERVHDISSPCQYSLNTQKIRYDKTIRFPASNKPNYYLKSEYLLFDFNCRVSSDSVLPEARLSNLLVDLLGLQISTFRMLITAEKDERKSSYNGSQWTSMWHYWRAPNTFFFLPSFSAISRTWLQLAIGKSVQNWFRHNCNTELKTFEHCIHHSWSVQVILPPLRYNNITSKPNRVKITWRSRDI